MPSLLESVRDAVGDTLFYYAVSPAVKILVLLFLGILPLITYLVLAERKILGFMQARLGPEPRRAVGAAAADRRRDEAAGQGGHRSRARRCKWAFVLAPCLVVAPAFIIFAVIPFGPPAGEGDGARPGSSPTSTPALLFIIALATIGVYGLILGGWASNNKFSLMGGLRSAAQMISYEVPQGLALVGPLMLAGTHVAGRDRRGAARAAASGSSCRSSSPSSSTWSPAWPSPTATRSTCRRPESELVAGFHTEYSGMRFALFFLGEYANMIVDLGGGDDAVPRRLAAAVPERRGARLPRRACRRRRLLVRRSRCSPSSSPTSGSAAPSRATASTSSWTWAGSG